jgi:threonine aldolase
VAARLGGRLAPIPGVTITQPVQANAVFAILPEDAIGPLRERTPFYTWDERTGEVRLMCSWDTTVAEVDAFADGVAALSRRSSPGPSPSGPGSDAPSAG